MREAGPQRADDHPDADQRQRQERHPEPDGRRLAGGDERHGDRPSRTK